MGGQSGGTSWPRADADLIIVGAGIVGLAHALEARRRGLRVIVLERHQRAVGASVRNFGHVFLAAMAAGEALDAALDARERWIELGAKAGIDVLQHGTLVVARQDDELAILERVAADPRRRAELLTPAQAAQLAPIPTDDLVGALHGTLDLRVDPRTTVQALASLLERDPGAEIHWCAPVHAIEPGAVESSIGRVRAPLTIACPGPDFDTLPAGLQNGAPTPTRCKLQMLRVASPAQKSYGPALVTGLSLIRYPAFAVQPEAQSLRQRFAAERPELLDAGLHLLVTQLPDGDLIIGDTHEYADTVSPFGDERLDELILSEARELLGWPKLIVKQRWHGVYPFSATDGPFLVAAPAEGIRVVQIVAGIGMTTALGLAPNVLDELLATPTARREPAATPPPLAAAQPGSGS